MSYTKGLLLGIGLLLTSILLFAWNINSITTLGAIGRVVGGLIMFPGIVITFIGISKGRTLYIFSKKNNIKHIAFWHNDSETK